MSFSDYLTTVYSAALPDWAQLGGRLFIADGRNPVIVHDGTPANDRLLGSLPQDSDMTATATTGAGLTQDKLYVYGVQRLIRAGALEIPSAVVTDFMTTETGKCQGTLTLQDYQWPPETGAGWEVFYRVYRSKADAPLELFRVGTDLDQEDYEALTNGAFVDTAADSALDESVSYLVGTQSAQLTSGNEYVDANETNYLLPPVRYLRAWRGRLLAAGSLSVSDGSVTVDAGDLDLVTVAAPGTVLATDVGAFLWLPEELQYFIVTAADPEAGTWTLDKACAVAHAAGTGYRLFRDFDTLYISNALPDNIEGHELVNEVISNQGGGDRINGLAVNGGAAFVLRRKSIELLDGASDGWTLQPHPDNPPGCVSHATIADRYSPAVIYYAGSYGVWMATQGQAVQVSGPVQTIIEDEVDHAMDGLAHAVYDPGRQWYWLWLYGTDWQDYGAQIPQLCLVYDLRAKQWYRCELAASRADLWRNSAGRLIPVIGVGGGVARLDYGDSDGEPFTLAVVSATTTVVTFADSAALPLAGNGLAGQPIHIGGVRRLIKCNTASTVTIYGTWPAAPATGAVAQIGSIRWRAVTQELGLEVLETNKQIETLALLADKDTATNEIVVTIAGQRDEAAQDVEYALDLANSARLFLKGPALGLRAHSAAVTLAGDTDRPVTIRALKMEVQDASRQ